MTDHDSFITKTTIEPTGEGDLSEYTVAVKDNISTADVPTTCGSRMLEGYRPPYDATVIERLRAAGATIVGKANMDEFGMGSTTETSAFGPTENPVAPGHVPGGSSGGSAAAVAAGEADVALGSDTGGSIRCPAAFCGVVGIKPTYGLVSRYGLVAYANSLEQIGPIAGSVEEAAAVLDVIAGVDDLDGTTLSAPPSTDTAPDVAPPPANLSEGAAGSEPDGTDQGGKSANADSDGAGPAEGSTAHTYRSAADGDVDGLKIGVPRQLLEGAERTVVETTRTALDRLEGQGAVVREISLPAMDHAVAAYYVIAMSEAASNLARFDGVRYGHRSHSGGNWNESFARTRAAGFGDEVIRRVLLGTFATSAGYHDRYYAKAQDARARIARTFDEAFDTVDLVASPTMPVLPFELGEGLEDPLTMYLADANTVPANLAALPAISVPAGAVDGLPVGLQLVGPAFGERRLIRAASALA